MDNSKVSHTASIAGLYRFLAQTMRYPDEEWMGEVFFENFFQLAEKIVAASEIANCKEILATEKKWFEILQVEYTRMFISAYPHIIAPPYGSIYQRSDSGEQRKLSDATLLFYNQKGFDLHNQREPPDWLVHELEFMAVLAAEDNGSLDDFINTHFRPWFPAFSEKVEQETTHPYYIIATRLIDFFTI